MFTRWRYPISIEAQATEGFMGLLFSVLLLIPHLVLLLIKTRFIIPVLYTLIVDIRFPEWQAAHRVLSNRIEIVLIALVVVSWIITLVRAIKRRRDNH